MKGNDTDSQNESYVVTILSSIGGVKFYAEIATKVSVVTNLGIENECGE